MASYVSAIPSFSEISPLNNSVDVNHKGFIVSATSNNTNPAFAFGGYNNQQVTHFRSQIDSSSGFLTCTFPRKIKIARYKIELGYYNTKYSNMASWNFEGLVNGVWVVLHSGTNTETPQTFTIDLNPTYVEGIRINCISRHGSNSWGVDEITVYELVNDEYVLFKNNNAYTSYSLNTNSWNSISTSSPTEQDFLNGNKREELSQIPESAWAELSGEVELLYYIDDTSIEEVQFNIETEPFTLKDEFEGKDVSIIEYTDNPTQKESVVEIDTEPFDFYYEVGDSVEILYYTDDKSVTSANLEITANYSPLDEINEDFDIVTWSSEPVEDVPLLTFNMNALPKGQLVVENEDTVIHGDVMRVVVEKVETLGKDNGIVRLLMSFDSGKTFRYYRKGKWTNINKANVQEVAVKGSTIEEINSITEDEWKAIGVSNGFGGVRFAYYIEESVREVDTAVLDAVTVSQENVATKTPRIEESSLYILNTVSTINVNLQGRKITGTLSDEDSTKVQYRVFLNGDAYFPSSGDFTPLAEPVQAISINIDHRKVRMGQDNFLTVEFRDYWGTSDFWSTTFVGEPIGLLFKDPNNDYYANEIGEVLKYLDIGTIIAGGTSIEHEVLLVNKIGYHIKNPNIRSYTNESGISIEMSKTQSPFIASSDITFERQIDEGESVPFYIRIKADSKATPRTGAEFQLRVYADVADGVVI